jgi:hypothetical protein
MTEELYKYRDDWSSYIGGLYSKDFKVGDTITWLGHDGVFGYLTGEEFISNEEHFQKKDEFPVYKKVGEFDIRGTVFHNDETLFSLISRKPRMIGKNRIKRMFIEFLINKIQKDEKN